MEHIGTPHSRGTRTGYRYWKCRCAECKAWNTRESKRYRAARAEAGRPVPNGWDRYNGRREGAYS